MGTPGGVMDARPSVQAWDPALSLLPGRGMGDGLIPAKTRELCGT